MNSPRDVSVDLREVELPSQYQRVSAHDDDDDDKGTGNSAEGGDGSLHQSDSSRGNQVYDSTSFRRSRAAGGKGLSLDPDASPTSSAASSSSSSSAVSSAISPTNFSRQNGTGMHCPPSTNGGERSSQEPELAPQPLLTSHGVMQTRSESFRSVSSSSSTGDFAEREEGSISTSEDERPP